ncbi:MAG: hypothetical protein HQK51_19720 [Oligoflexia bacterium]|nr:hypothetical protein [Oligoflexia bacterium]
MDLCNDCEYNGYSPELCEMHLKHIASVQRKLNQKKKTITKENKKLNIKASARIVFRGGAYTLIKFSSALGGAIGTLKSLTKKVI